jgi:acyl-coenzyme A synthetase/AMP-(fatty) acid ligase
LAAEVEETLEKMPQIKEVAVSGVPEPGLKEELSKPG